MTIPKERRVLYPLLNQKQKGPVNYQGCIASIKRRTGRRLNFKVIKEISGRIRLLTLQEEKGVFLN